jgi:cytidine deaminase
MGGAAAVTPGPRPAPLPERKALVAAARDAAARAYAPYSRFHVGAALAFADGGIVTGANVENASYGLSLCAETVAVASAMSAGRRGGLVAVAVVGGAKDTVPGAVTPCGRCRQVLSELAQAGGTDPVIWCGEGDADGVAAPRLSDLLPHAFGPASLT